MNRIEQLKTSIRNEFDGYLVMNQTNMFYFTDALGASILLIPNDRDSTLMVYSVNYEAAKEEAENCKVELARSGEDIVKKTAEQIKELKLRKIGFDTMPAQTHMKFKKALGKTVTLKPNVEHIWNLRKIKDKDELKKIRRAAELTVEGVKTAHETLQPGLKELEVAAEIEYAMRSKGSYGPAFETIVASGPRSAFPHGGCGERRLKNGDLVVVDLGAIYQSYRADMTRTFVIGKPSMRHAKIHGIVKEAQENAFQRIHDGVKATEVDAAARKTIETAGYAEHFVHGLGHGIGLEVHEQPVLNATSKDVLRAGNVVTDEPGVYIVGFGGFRVEDTVLVEKEGAKRLTSGDFFKKP